jgi:large subunit ribosomal protein L15
MITQAENLIGSGQEVVVAQAIYAIVGAVALERGGELANRIARERILEPLGVTFPMTV